MEFDKESSEIVIVGGKVTTAPAAVAAQAWPTIELVSNQSSPARGTCTITARGTSASLSPGGNPRVSFADILKADVNGGRRIGR
jgi:hypothetical protein